MRRHDDLGQSAQWKLLRERLDFIHVERGASDFARSNRAVEVLLIDDSPAGDGLLTAVKIASLVSMHGRLEALIDGLKDYPQVILNVKVKSKPPLDSLPEVSRALAEAQSALGENGRVVLRYSGTEPLARVMVEAEHDADVHRFSQSLANALRASIGA